MVGCEMPDKGTVETRSYERTNVRGFYVAGDQRPRPPVAQQRALFAPSAFMMKLSFWSGKTMFHVKPLDSVFFSTKNSHTKAPSLRKTWIRFGTEPSPTAYVDGPDGAIDPAERKRW
jgi:hypothetical protein